MGDKENSAGTHVQVAVRCRPLNSREKASGNLHVVNTESAHNRIRVAHKKLDRTYQYDHVFGPFASQEEVFVSTVEPIVREMLQQGFSTTVFAYGQTGTGKTHTMEGDITSPENMGVIPRSVHAIFNYLDGISADYTVRTSFLELYNEELADLLADANSKSKVVLREDTKRGVVCCGLEEVQVLTAKDIFNILGKGIQQRKTAQTLMNKNSSRSHSIFTLKIMIKECMPDGQEVMRNGQLNLVDLAGSECVGRSGAKHARAREAGNINQSLLTLGRVITALVEHHPHVPYRDSKLTRLLQESLGGRAKTCIIATVTSSSDALDETLSSLDYALKAKSIENKPVANQKLSKTHLLKEYAGEVESLRSMLQASRDKNGVYIEPWRFDQMENTLASQGNQIGEMEAVLHSRNSETKELKAERDAFKTKGEELEEELEASKGREEALSATLQETQGRLERTEADLVASQEQVADLQKKLASTERELEATRVELAATRVVVEEQASTERALLSEAAMTEASLEAAERDVDGLRAKVARQEEEAAVKRDNAASFGNTATAATRDVSDARISEGNGSGRGGVGRRGPMRNEAAERKIMRTERRAKGSNPSNLPTSRLAEQADLKCKEIASGVSTGAASTEDLMTTTVSALDKAVAEQKAAMSTWGEEMARSLDSLRNGLETHESDLVTLCKDVERRAEQAGKEMVDFKDKCASELAEVRSWADERIAAQTEQMELQSEQAKVVAARSKEETKVEVAQLMESLSTLMSGLQTNAAARADSQAAAAGEAWSRSISAARSLGPEVSRKMGGIAESVASRSEVVVQNLALSANATASNVKERQSAAAAFAASTGTVSDAFETGAGRLSNLADDASSSMKENLAAVSEAVGGTAEACRASADNLSKGTALAAEEIAALAVSADSNAAAMALQGGEQVEGLTAAVGSLESSHAASIGQCARQIEDHVEEACAVREPSGGTPNKKNYPRPSKFSTTRPHEDIMSEARGGAKSGNQLEAFPSSSQVQAVVQQPPPGDSTPPDDSERDAVGGGDAEREVAPGEEQEKDRDHTAVAVLEGVPPESPERHPDAATVPADINNEGRASPSGEENLSAARDTNGGRGGEEDGQAPSEAATKPGGDADGTLEPTPPLCEATNTSNKAPPRSKIPTVRRVTRRTRGAV
ncbi:unnamed protein product [Scytosiphon promiscuus]